MVINDLESFTFIFVIYAFLTAIFNSHNSYLYAKKVNTHMLNTNIFMQTKKNNIQKCKVAKKIFKSDHYKKSNRIILCLSVCTEGYR